MWFDAPIGRTDAPPADARAIGLAAALFSFPVVLPFLAVLDPLAKLAAKAFGTV
jgi:NADH-quinone oxidoreductase subunit N